MFRTKMLWSQTDSPIWCVEPNKIRFGRRVFDFTSFCWADSIPWVQKMFRKWSEFLDEGTSNKWCRCHWPNRHREHGSTWIKYVSWEKDTNPNLWMQGSNVVGKWWLQNFKGHRRTFDSEFDHHKIQWFTNPQEPTATERHLSNLAGAWVRAHDEKSETSKEFTTDVPLMRVDQQPGRYGRPENGPKWILTNINSTWNTKNERPKMRKGPIWNPKLLPKPT